MRFDIRRKKRFPKIEHIKNILLTNKKIAKIKFS